MLDTTIMQKGEHRRQRIGATDGIRKQVGEVRRQVDVMDALLRAQLVETDPLLTEWQTVTSAIRLAANKAIPSATAATDSGTAGTGATSSVAAAATGGGAAQQAA